MQLIHRQTQLADLPACAALVEHHFSGKKQPVTDFIGLWTELLQSRRAHSAVIEDRSQTPFRIVGFGMAICVKDEYVQRVLAATQPYVAWQVLQEWKTLHTLPALSLEDIQTHNKDAGLNILGLHTLWGLPGMTDEECRPIRDKMLSSLFANMSGYKIKRFVKEVYGKEELERHTTFGFKELNRYSAFFSTHDRPVEAEYPYLIGMSRDEVMRPTMEGRLIRELFRYNPPVCQFTSQDQEVLQLALTGMSDAHIASILGCGKEELKNRWEAAFSHIPQEIAEVLFNGYDNRQKRAILVTWLKNHPEERRPILFFEGVDLLGDLPPTPPLLPKANGKNGHSSRPEPTSNGGYCVRALRKERKLSLEDLAFAADITPLALSNIELKGAVPQRARLLDLLNALDHTQALPLKQRREVLDAFGYSDSQTPPNQADLELALAAWNESFKDAPYPAYMLDITQAVRAWNGVALHLINVSLEKAKSITLFDLLFSPAARGDIQLVNAEEVVKISVAHIWNDLFTYRDQPWCQEVIETARKKYPLFAFLYDPLTEETASKSMSAIELVVLQDAKGQQLNFRLVGLDLVIDPRFRVVQYVPMDAATMHYLSKLTHAAQVETVKL